MPKIFTVGDYMVYFWTHESTIKLIKILLERLLNTVIATSLARGVAIQPIYAVFIVAIVILVFF